MNTPFFLNPRPEDSGSKDAPQSGFRWATVTLANPLRIQLDGDTAALPIIPDSLVKGLAVGERVWCQLYGRRVIILGSGSGSGGGGGLDQATADARYVNIPGDTMTGPLILSGPPSVDMGAVNRAWITGDHARGSFPTTTVANAVSTRPTWTGTAIGEGVSLSGTTWTVIRRGYWLLSMWGKFSANIANGARMFGNWNIRSGNPYIRAQVGPGDSYVSVTGLVYLYEEDQFIAEFYQNSGASMTLVGSGYIKWIGE